MNANMKNDASVQVSAVVDLHRRRVRRWMIATTTLWVFAAAFLAAWVLAYLVYLGPKVHELIDQASVDAAVTSRFVHLWLMTLRIWPPLFLLAGGATVGLQVASRQATLRQIQSSLAQITAELESMSRR